MTIDWTTVLFEIINFALLVLIMVRFVFRPVAKILDERRAEIVARAEQTAEREAAAEAARAHYEAELAGIDASAEQRVAAALREARSEAEAIIGRARAQAREVIDKGSAELVASRRRTLARFRTEILEIGADAARRIIRELGAPELDLAFARRAAHALIDANEGGLELVRVDHSTDADPEALTQLLTKELGPTVELELDPDPELIGGVRLHAHGHEVEASVSATLDSWYQGLARDSSDAEDEAR